MEKNFFSKGKCGQSNSVNKQVSLICLLSAFLVVVVQSPSCVLLFETPWTAASQASLSVTISQGLIKQVSGHLIFSTYLNCSVK